MSEPDVDHLDAAEAVPNRDDRAEQSVLGAMMMWPKARAEIVQTGLRGQDFYAPKHEVVFDAITALDGTGELCDPPAILGALLASGECAIAGGHGYVAGLIRVPDVPVTAVRDARIVIDLSRRREADRVASAALQRARDPQATLADIQEALATPLTPVAAPEQDSTPTRVGDLYEAVVDDIDSPQQKVGLGWPWVDVNRGLNPMTAGQLVVIAARFGVGKSIACGNIGWHVAHEQREHVLILSTEMTAAEYTQRMIAAHAKVHLKRMMFRNLTQDDWAKVDAAREAFHETPLEIVFAPELTLAGVRAYVRDRRPALAIVDQLAQMTGPNPKAEERDKLGDLAYGLKTIAGVEGLPILAAAQVNRAATARVGKTPTRDDIADSDKIARAADLLLLLHSEETYDRETPRAGEIDLIVGKQRNGGLDTFCLANQGHFARFVDMSTGAEPARSWTPHDAIRRAS